MKYITIGNKQYKLLNKNTKKAKQLKAQYVASDNYTIFNVYARPSYTKENIEKEIKAFMRENNLWGYKILSYCIMNFKCGYMNERYLLIETHKNNYAIESDEYI